jgi:hypothetical protein
LRGALGCATIGMGEAAMTDYALSKLFFDLQRPAAAAAYRADPAAMLADAGLRPERLAAIRAGDAAALAPHVNPYLLRYFFQVAGMPDAEFIRRLNAPPITSQGGTVDG